MKNKVLIYFSVLMLFSGNAIAAQQEYQGSFTTGVWVGTNSRNVTFTVNTLDAADEKFGTIFQIPKSGEIAKIGFLTGTVATTDSPTVLDIRLETVSTTDGNPTGNLFDTNSNVSQNIVDTDDNTWFLVTLTATATVTLGDYAAVVITAPGSGTFDIDIRSMDGIWGKLVPYKSLFTASWTKDVSAPIIALEYDDGSYEYIDDVYPVKAVNDSLYNSGSTPDERGLKFKLPFPVVVTGCVMWFDLNGTATIKLYDSDGSSVLASISVDKDISTTTTKGRRIYKFTSSATLLKDTFYRLTIVPDGVSSNLIDFEADTVAIMDSFSGGQNFHYTERTDAGAWTDITTRVPVIQLLINSFDDGANGVGVATISYGFMQ